MKNKGAQVSLAIVCVVIGFAVTMQMKSVFKNTSYSLNQQTTDELRAELIKEKDKSDSLYRQVVEYKNEITLFQQKAAENSDYSAVLAKQIQNAEIYSGRSDVEGPGIIFKLDDSKHTSTTDASATWYLLHDSDLLMAVNELRDAGAEAISINGERLLATTEIRCAGSVVSVNNNRIAPPFEIRAIGDPETLEKALKMPSGIVDVLSPLGFDISIQKANKIKIERYKGNVEFKFAQPVVTTE